MIEYTTLYFDIDNTLLDFYAAEHHAIKKLFSQYGLPNDDETISLYSEINKKYWKKCEIGEMKKVDILVARFKETLSVLGIENDAVVMNQTYFGLLAQEHPLIKGADEILSYLKKKGYKIYATTNGVSTTQFKRIRESGLEPYFDGIFVSQDTGYQKPSVEYYKYVTENTDEKDKSRILCIGDSMTSDIKGGIDYGIDTCWYDGFSEEKIYEPTYTIKKLSDLGNIL